MNYYTFLQTCEREICSERNMRCSSSRIRAPPLWHYHDLLYSWLYQEVPEKGVATTQWGKNRQAGSVSVTDVITVLKYRRNSHLSQSCKARDTSLAFFVVPGATSKEICNPESFIQALARWMWRWELVIVVESFQAELNMNERTWLDHPVYKIYRNEARSLEAAILLPTSQVSTILSGEKTPGETVERIKEAYGESAARLPEVKFQEELERRITHSPEMLAMLKNNWTGQDLSGWHVYGSILMPAIGRRIEGTVFLNGNGARYNQSTIYEYVVARSLLDQRTIEHHTLVTISHP